MAKMTYNEIQAELNLLANASRAKYGSEAYSAGYFQSQLASLIMDLPKHKQLLLVQTFRKSTAEIELK